MSFKNLLDLRKKSQPQIQIIERIIFQKRSLVSDVFLALSVILVASGIIWGISKADSINSGVINIRPVQQVNEKNFSAHGVVSDISAGTISIVAAKGSDDSSRTEYTFDTSTVTIIETKSYIPLNISDIQPGYRIIVQGVGGGNSVVLNRIISFGMYAVPAKKEVATTTKEVATTTTATTTDLNEQATSTNPVSDFVDHVIDTVTDVVNSVISVVTGTSTGTTTPADQAGESLSTSTTDTSTTTDDTTISTSTSDIATSTDVSTSTDSDSTPTGVVEIIINTVTDVVDMVVGAVTGEDGSSPSDSTSSPDPVTVSPAN